MNTIYIHLAARSLIIQRQKRMWAIRSLKTQLLGIHIGTNTLENNLKDFPGSLVVKSFHCSVGMSSIPSQGTKILHATGLGQKQTDQQEPKGVTPLTKSHSSTALGWIPNSQNQAISASCYPQPPAWLPHFPSVNLKGIHPWCPMITTDKMR